MVADSLLGERWVSFCSGEPAVVAAGGDEDINEFLWLENELGVNGEDDRICPVSGDLTDETTLTGPDASPNDVINGDDELLVTAASIGTLRYKTNHTRRNKQCRWWRSNDEWSHHDLCWWLIQRLYYLQKNEKKKKKKNNDNEQYELDDWSEM